MSSAPRELSLFAPAQDCLGTALTSGLRCRGWTVHVPARDDRWEYPPSASLVEIVAGAADRDPTPRPGTFFTDVVPSGRQGRWICIASLDAASQLLRPASWGAVVINADLPFRMLLGEVENALTQTTGHDRFEAVRSLQRRSAEVRALDSLTPRERTVLCQLMHGRTVQQIAGESSRATHTIRSQVQSLLHRLGARSQIEAVAIAHRSGSHAGLAPCLRSLHSFH
ncbi:MAG: helix-turn-helix transcriptional regulator [Actinomycetales bacterium]